MTKSDRDQITATIALLAERFPKCFFIFERRRRPLQIGIRHELEVLLDGAVTADELRAALRTYCGNEFYLRHCVAGMPRVDLGGNLAGVVSTEQADGAAKALCAINRKKAQRKAEKEEAAKPKRLSLSDLKAAALARKAAQEVTAA
jgi:ProP effector